MKTNKNNSHSVSTATDKTEVKTIGLDIIQSPETTQNILNSLDASIYATDPETGEILFCSEHMKHQYNLKDNVLGKICYEVFQECKTEKCDFCPCFKLDKEPDSIVVWEEQSSVTNRIYRNTDRYIDWIDGRKVHLQHSVDITDIMQTQESLQKTTKELNMALHDSRDANNAMGKLLLQMEQRDIMQQAVNKVAALVLSTDSENSIDSTISKSLELICNAVDADRVFIWRNETIDDVLWHVCEYGWIKDDLLEETPVSVGMKVTHEKERANWIGRFLRGECISGSISKMPKSDRDFFSNYGMVSIVIIPLFIKDEFWGFFSIDDCYHDREVTEDELDILKSVSFMLASAINQHFLTEEVKMAQEHAMQKLENLVEERTVKLAKAQKAAEHANKVKSSFLASMSHEIRTPMNAILGITDILMQKETLPPEISEGLGRIFNSCDMLLAIINDLLDFSKIEAGKMDVHSSKYDVASLIIDSVQLNKIRSGENSVDFELQIDENIPARLIGDELRIKQIMNNLLSNAFKYTDSGKITLSIVSETWPGGDGVTLVIIVKDTGRGMTKDQLRRLFEKYSRFDENIGGFIEGTGLGLAITQNLVSMMNGSINVESEPGTGSTFVIRLPQKTVDNVVLGSAVAENMERFRTNYITRNARGPILRSLMPYGSVLVVDDIEANLYVAVGLLKPYGLRIETVQSGEAAIKLIKQGKTFDVIFMDHMMPQMDGIEATSILRKLGYTKPIVALTANAVTGQAETYMQNGFDEFISKPIDIRQLNSILNRFIRNVQPPEVIESNSIKTDVAEPVMEELSQDQKDQSSAGILSKSIDGLDLVKGLEMHRGDEAAFLRVLRSFSVSVRALLDETESATEDNMHEYKTKVHGIKGASYMLYLEPIGQYAEELEAAAKEGNIGFIELHNKSFHDAAYSIVDDIDAMLAEIEAESPKSSKEKPDEKLLIKLLTACKEYDMTSADETMSKIEEYRYEADEGLTDWLRLNVDVMNYDQIITKLSKTS